MYFGYFTYFYKRYIFITFDLYRTMSAATNWFRKWKTLPCIGRRRRLCTTTGNLESLRRDIETDVHLRAIEDLLQSLGTDATHGLSTTVACDLLNKTGPNELTPPRKISNALRFLHLCFGGFSSLIWV